MDPVRSPAWPRSATIALIAAIGISATTQIVFNLNSRRTTPVGTDQARRVAEDAAATELQRIDAATVLHRDIRQSLAVLRSLANGSDGAATHAKNYLRHISETAATPR